jgi:hypothetical protein
MVELENISGGMGGCSWAITQEQVVFITTATSPRLHTGFTAITKEPHLDGEWNCSRGCIWLCYKTPRTFAGTFQVDESRACFQAQTNIDQQSAQKSGKVGSWFDQSKH